MLPMLGPTDERRIPYLGMYIRMYTTCISICAQCYWIAAGLLITTILCWSARSFPFGPPIHADPRELYLLHLLCPLFPSPALSRLSSSKVASRQCSPPPTRFRPPTSPWLAHPAAPPAVPAAAHLAARQRAGRARYSLCRRASWSTRHHPCRSRSRAHCSSCRRICRCYIYIGRAESTIPPDQRNHRSSRPPAHHHCTQIANSSEARRDMSTKSQIPVSPSKH
jgi:hypothetical protein